MDTKDLLPARLRLPARSQIPTVRNESGSVFDMTDVRKTVSAVAAAGCVAMAAAALAVAGIAATPAVSHADPAGHQVTYTVTTTSDLMANIQYMNADPPSQAAFNADSSKYMTTVHARSPAASRWSIRPRWQTRTSGRSSPPVAGCGSTRSSTARSPSTVRWWCRRTAAAEFPARRGRGDRAVVTESGVSFRAAESAVGGGRRMAGLALWHKTIR